MQCKRITIFVNRGDVKVFIYILNLLNDGVRKDKCISENLALEIINDTRYIIELGGIKKGAEFKLISERLGYIVELLFKYNLTFKESMCILKKILYNKKNIWILESFYNIDYRSRLDISNLTLYSIISEILQKVKLGHDELKVNYMAV